MTYIFNIQQEETKQVNFALDYIIREKWGKGRYHKSRRLRKFPSKCHRGKEVRDKSIFFFKLLSIERQFNEHDESLVFESRTGLSLNESCEKGGLYSCTR